jgi:hypothetical protein
VPRLITYRAFDLPISVVKDGLMDFERSTVH